MLSEAVSHPSCRPLPVPLPLLEECVAALPLNRAASLAFALSRCRGDAPLMLVVQSGERRELGRPSLHGIARLWPGTPLLLVVPRDASAALWAMEQALKSGSLGGVVGAIDSAGMTQTRRLDFAARDGGTPAVLLRARSGGLSAARRRWRIAAAPSGLNMFDTAAPGVSRLHAELVRQRDGPPGEWLLDLDLATGRVAVAAGLAADGARTDARRAA